ncbi:glucan endo-1,3-beta-glucosidase 12, partial [Eucalyptus grandis]|uniref:glucan endo-1,3-beta-glucosidase 12 n=1 Tax=Eucalyptus grandis TaxID=71139 RepID=UPI00192F1012
LLPSALPSPVTTTIGVTYSPANSTAAPDRVAAAVSALRIPSVRLLDPTPRLLRAFLYSNTSLLLSVPNALVPSLAANRSVALSWLYRHVVPFYPRARVSAISVGSNILESHPNYAGLLVPALRNLQSALRDLGIRDVAVSTTFSFVNVMTTTFPPSAAQFQEPFAEALMKPLLDFLKDTNSSFMVNIYPYNLYRLRCEIPLGFALFQEQPFMYRDDLTTGVRYRNLFDMMVDAVVTAMAVAGHENIPVIVAETGWPNSSPDAAEIDANEHYSEMYVKGLLGHLRSGQGTPLRKEGVAEAYVYELVDEEAKETTSSQARARNWGILYANLSEKYEVQFSCAARYCESLEELLIGFVLMLLILVWLIWYIPNSPW